MDAVGQRRREVARCSVEWARWGDSSLSRAEAPPSVQRGRGTRGGEARSTAQSTCYTPPSGCAQDVQEAPGDLGES